MSSLDQSERFLEDHRILKEDESINFACGPEVACFNTCCSGINLNLMPYDVLRLRQVMNISSKDIFEEFLTVIFSPDAGFPLAVIKLMPDQKESCPFVTDGGCSVYQGRPSVCRAYPFGRAVRFDGQGGKETKIMLIEESHCLGGNTRKTWTYDAWFENQELGPYIASNDRCLKLIAAVKPKGRLPAKLAQTSFLALYNLDNFAEFISHVKLFDRLELSDERKREIMQSEETRLDFAYDWMELVMLGASDNLKPLR